MSRTFYLKDKQETENEIGYTILGLPRFTREQIADIDAITAQLEAGEISFDEAWKRRCEISKPYPVRRYV